MNATDIKQLIGKTVVIDTTTVTVTGELIAVRAWSKDNTVAGIIYASNTAKNAVGRPAQFKIAGREIHSIQLAA